MAGFCDQLSCPGCFEIAIERSLLPGLRRKARQVSPFGVASIGHDPATRELLEVIYETPAEFRRSGLFFTGEDALRDISGFEPDAVLVDLLLPDQCGIICARKLLGLNPELKIVIIAASAGDSFMDCAYSIGLSGVLVKPIHLSQLLTTLRLACYGFTKPDRTGRPLPHRGRKYSELNEHETQVLRCLADGLLYKEIPGKLGITESRLRKIQHRVFVKLRAQNRTEAVRAWQRQMPC